MKLHIELDVDNGREAAHTLNVLSAAIHQREAAQGDAIERKVLQSGIYELDNSRVVSVDIY